MIQIIGLDPGAKGAMAVLTLDRRLRLYRFDGKSEQDIAHTILAESVNTCYAFLEKVHAMPSQGSQSTFTFGKNLGFLRGVLVASGIPFEDVTPQVWQRGVGMGQTFPTQQHRKRAATQLAQQLYPGIKITQDASDGILIAEYGRRLHTREK